MRSVLLILALLAFTQATIQAQCFIDPDSQELVLPDGSLCPNAVTSAVPFLRITPDARSGAMGDVGIGLSPDANAMHFNASKLAFADAPFSAAITYTPWLRNLGLSDVYLTYLSMFRKLNDLQTIGVSLRYFSLGSINFTDINGEPLGTGNPNEFEIKGAYARKLSDRLAAAVGAKVVYSNLAAGQRVNGTGEQIEAGWAGAADVSFTYENMDLDASNLRIGVAITNIGSKITYTNSAERDFLPANLGIGAAWQFELDTYNKLTLAVDVNKALTPTPCQGADCDEDGDGVLDYRQQSPVSALFGSFTDYNEEIGFKEEIRELAYSFGLEYWYDEQFAVRAGYYTEHQTKGARQFLTVGLGLRYNIFGLNFSYLVPTTNQRNPLDNTLRFTLLFDFAGGVDEGN